MIKIAIAGYGNLGKGAESAVSNADDMTLVGVFTRRSPDTVKIKTKDAFVASFDDIEKYKDKIDVLINCGGSATDLPVTTPYLAEHFNVVDSFDTHAKINEHFLSTDKKAVTGKKVAVISVGWDPGLFSLSRIYMNAVLPNGSDYTFWGKGVSQGHSDAIRRIDGVLDARQYTIPIEKAVKSVRNGENPTLTAGQKHKRECFVAVCDGADIERIEKEIKNMPNYFADYETTVHFVSEEELKKNHSGLPHGGTVIRTGVTGENGENRHTVEFSLKLDSNPEFTGSVLVSYARAAYKLNKNGDFGCKTVFDIPPAALMPTEQETLLKTLL